MTAMLIFIWLVLIFVFYLGYSWHSKWRQNLLDDKPTQETSNDLAKVVTLELATVDISGFDFDIKLYHNMLEVLSAIYDLKKHDSVIEYNQYQFTKNCINVKLDNGNLLKLATISSYKGSLEFIPKISQKLCEEVTRIYLSLIAFYTWSIDNSVTNFSSIGKEVQTQNGKFLIKAKQ
ncbi:MAG: hypothetical protein FWG68_06210 [Defluviitaleaceae bacterium]|nr:hypothetical protein [Defluviitaleaceae bacterium]